MNIPTILKLERNCKRRDRDLRDAPSEAIDVAVTPPPCKVSVPCSNLFDMVTVRCGHCTNLWSVNMGMAAGFNSNSTSQDDSSSSHHNHQEIQRIKANNPNISHREAFSAAAKNWAHFPHIHFGLMLEANNHKAESSEATCVGGRRWEFGGSLSRRRHGRGEGAASEVAGGRSPRRRQGIGEVAAWISVGFRSGKGRGERAPEMRGERAPRGESAVRERVPWGESAEGGECREGESAVRERPP
ncbi:hypothetical protein L6452_02830 [Arctium lappa]|uniref:Uncharacterized protein n=1 Tax=Arctium lappa TaxID=4217 RepID=A0ACB9FLI6_ARCLA|nr:hypothetical protein L6452_02830 [Arctium lappa]